MSVQFLSRLYKLKCSPYFPKPNYCPNLAHGININSVYTEQSSLFQGWEVLGQQARLKINPSPDKANRAASLMSE